jgi:hypothetical protein
MSKTFATLNIGSTNIRLLFVEGRQVVKWGSTPLPPGLVKDGLILRPKVVGALISTLFKSAGVPKKQVIVSLAGLSFTHRMLSLPSKMTGDSLSEAIQRAARKEMMLPDELYLRWQAISGGSDENSFFVLGVPSRPIDVLRETLAAAEIPPYLVDLSPLALARTIHRDEAIAVNLEPDCFDIVLIAGGIPAIMHTMTPRGEGATLEDNIRRLAGELLKTIEFYNNNHPQNPIDPAVPVMVTGELSGNALTAGLISNETGRPVEPVTLPLSFPGEFPAAAFATNIGLALKKLPQKSSGDGQAARFRDINLNILSEKYETGKVRLKPLHGVLALVIVAGLGLLLPANQFHSQSRAETSQLRTDLAGISQELNQAQSLISRARQIEDTINKLEAETETARQNGLYISAKGGDYADNLKLVTGALPVKASFTTVDIGSDLITLKGEADNAFTVVDYVVALEAMKKYSEVRIVFIGESSTPAVGASDVTFNIVITKPS